jgi:hypothetical protein
MVPAPHSLVSNPTGHDEREVSLDSNIGPTDKQVPDKGISARSVIETLLAGLQASSDCFGPLRMAVDGVGELAEVYKVSEIDAFSCPWLILAKRGSDESKEYEKLKKKLEHILRDIAQHTGSTNRLFMTPSIEQIYRSVIVACMRQSG